MNMSATFLPPVYCAAIGRILFLDKWMPQRYIRRTLLDSIMTELNRVKRV